MKKINVITLGCAKNRVDSEHLSAQLAAAGYEVVFDSDRTDAKTVVINTCGFIGDAKQESIDTILNAVAAKNAGRIERLFVIGCLSERYADELRAEIPEVLRSVPPHGRNSAPNDCYRRPRTTHISKSPRAATGNAATAQFL